MEDSEVGKGRGVALGGFGDRSGRQLHPLRELRYVLALVCQYQARTRDPMGVQH
jgi:hypothetical protein